MRHLKTILEELDIGYTMPVQPVLLPASDPARTRSPLQSPPSGVYQPSAGADLGNAGGFQASEMSVAPGRSFQGGIPSFR